ncbi:MAG: hypothetical protein DELT_01312 [Desulfovibrio sp.]
MAFTTHAKKIAQASALFAALCFIMPGNAQTAQGGGQKPIILKTMGSLFFGGTVAKDANGVTFSGQYDWETAMTAPDLIKGVVAYEPGAVIFPAGETLADIPGTHPALIEAYRPRTVPLEEFKKLTRMPILIIYGDYVPQDPYAVFDVDLWRSSIRAKQFVEAVNRHGSLVTEQRA